jgi:DNA-binding winged helix-turn-helix (wHTH) protein
MEERRHTFGSFVLDSVAGTLSRDGEQVPVGQRGVALLTALLEARGEPVSKDDLLARGWPGLIVEEANLSVQVAPLRKAIGQAENGADWIATVPRFGYRFLRQVAPTATPPLEPLRPLLCVLPSEGLTDAGSGYFAHGVIDGIRRPPTVRCSSRQALIAERSTFGPSLQSGQSGSPPNPTVI